MKIVFSGTDENLSFFVLLFTFVKNFVLKFMFVKLDSFLRQNGSLYFLSKGSSEGNSFK